MEPWLILGILSYTSYAISNSIDKYLMNHRFNPLSTNTVKMFFDGIILLIIGSLFFNFNFSKDLILPAFVLGMFYAASGVLYFKVLKHKNVNEVVPFWQSLTLVLTFVGAVLFFSETPNIYNYEGIALVVAGVYVILSKKRLMLPSMNKAFSLILMIALLDTSYSLLVKQFLGSLEPIMIAISMYFTTAIILFVYSLVRKEQHNMFILENIKIIPASVFGAVGTLFLFLALSASDASKVYPMAGLQSVFVFMFASLFLKEKFHIAKLVGTITVFAGIYLVSV